MAEKLSALALAMALALALLLSSTRTIAAAEETIYGMLEKTVKPGACAQITDTLDEVYYVIKTDQSQKLVAAFLGKNIRVAISGVAEQHEGDAAWFFNLTTIKKSEAPQALKIASEKKISEPKTPEESAGANGPEKK